MEKEFLMGMGLPEEVADRILEENGRELQAVQQDWQNRCDEQAARQEQKLAEANFDAQLRQQILSAGGRNIKAITALLDTQQLMGQPEEVLLEALAQVKKDCGYLFYAPQVPAYAAGTGAAATDEPKSASLAEALRERFGK